MITLVAVCLFMCTYHDILAKDIATKPIHIKCRFTGIESIGCFMMHIVFFKQAPRQKQGPNGSR